MKPVVVWPSLLCRRVAGRVSVACLCLMVILALSMSAVTLRAAAPAEVSEITGSIQWPESWVVFAPLRAKDPVVEKSVLATIPDQLEVSDTQTLKPQTIRVTPGEPADLTSLFENTRSGNVAYVFLDLKSKRDQTVTLGMGSDWWIEVWVNGQPVFDTLAHGNVAYPPTMHDHKFNVQLRKGSNTLAIRYITGRNAALLAIGGPQQFAAVAKAVDPQGDASDDEGGSDFAGVAAKFKDRMVFPVDQQAIATAAMDVTFPTTDADLQKGSVAGVMPMPKRQLVFSNSTKSIMGDTEQRRFDEPVHILLSKFRYPSEDLHLDAIVWTTTPDPNQLPQGKIQVNLKDAKGNVVSSDTISNLSPNGLFFSVGFPPKLIGQQAFLQIIWADGDKVIGQSEAEFHINPPTNVATTGRLALSILNEPGATIDHAPMTVGVPFPQGALMDESHLKLVDEQGSELPLQTRVTGRWSRFGSIKWLLCDFTVDLKGKPRTLHLEYGPSVTRTAHQPLINHSLITQGMPVFETGRIKVTSKTIGFDPTGKGNYQPVLDTAALNGAFVEHENRGVFVVPMNVQHAIEENGSEKVVVRRTGWYVNQTTHEQFCQFVTRLIFHRHSPVVRIFHTWIFTGDGNQDRIANMGWQFKTASQLQANGFLGGFKNGTWLKDQSLVQYDHDMYLLSGTDKKSNGRAAGVMSVDVGTSRVVFGVRDFWQNFPSEMEINDSGFTFYNWPRRNPPATFKRPVGEWEVFRSRFAHEGELLDFKLPEEYAQEPLWNEITRGQIPLEGHLAKGNINSVNAQGIARTEEMYLYFADSQTSLADNAKVMQGLNDESLRAVVDPVWMTSCGIYDSLNPKDLEKFPEEERLYELAMLSPMEWVEQLGFYGMWLHGDYATWNMNLTKRRVRAYRSLRKAHHGFPYRAIPYVRSGDPRFLKLSDNAARHMVDANFCNFATEAVNDSVGPDHYRQQGFWHRCFLPWAGQGGPHERSYTMDCDYLWDNYYLTGNARIRDVTLLFKELVKIESTSLNGGRHTQSMLRSCIDMYRATFDPWYLNAYQELAGLHYRRYAGRPLIDPMSMQYTVSVVGYEHWRQADTTYYYYTGNDAYRQIALNAAMGHARPRAVVNDASAGDTGAGSHVHLAADAWKIGGDPLYLRRLVAALDVMNITSYEGDIPFMRGTPHGGHGSTFNDVMRSVPKAMRALADIDRDKWPEPVYDAIVMMNIPGERNDEGKFVYQMPETYVRLPDGASQMLSFSARGAGEKGPGFATLTYQIDGPDGYHDAGKFRVPQEMKLHVAPGVYRLTMSGDFGLFYPITEMSIPEVMYFPSSPTGTHVPAPALGFSFMVPKGVESFWIRFKDAQPGNRPVARVSVWNPAGERVWDKSLDLKSPPQQDVLIHVPAGQDGKLWRATGGEFTIDPQIPPYFSLTSSKWFDPRN